MTVSLFTFVEMYARALDTAERLLERGTAHAASLGVSETEMLGWRLIDDMQPVRFQIAVVINFARQWPARAAGLPVPPGVADDADITVLRAGIADARAFLAGLSAEQFAGRDAAPLTFQIGPGMAPTMPIGRWMAVFATTNLSFHLTTAYAILRARGVPLGKPDLFAGGL